MRKLSLAGAAGLSLLLLAAGSGAAWALVAAPAPMPIRLVTADAVLVGTVTSIEAKAVKAPQYPGDKTGVEYQVAVVKIEKGLTGTGGLTHLRVGFIPPPPQVPPQVVPDPAQGRVILAPRRPFRGPQPLVKGQQVCLFLMQHHSEPFFVAGGMFDVIDAKKDTTFQKSLGEMEQAARLLADPRAGLKSRDPRERYLTAALLITRYRSPRPYAQNPAQEPIDAEESRLILQALADADWAARGASPVEAMLGPVTMFYRLGVTPADGFQRPKDPRALNAAAQKWVRGHVDSYRVKRYVAGKADAR